MNRLSRMTVCRCLTAFGGLGIVLCLAALLFAAPRARAAEDEQQKGVALIARAQLLEKLLAPDTGPFRLRAHVKLFGLVEGTREGEYLLLAASAAHVVRPDPLPRVHRAVGAVGRPALAQAQRRGQAVPFPRGRPDAQPRVPPGAARRCTDHQALTEGHPGGEGVLHRGVPHRRALAEGHSRQSRDQPGGDQQGHPGHPVLRRRQRASPERHLSDRPAPLRVRGPGHARQQGLSQGVALLRGEGPRRSRRQSRNWSRRRPRTRPVSPLLRVRTSGPTAPARSRHNWSRRRSSTRAF